MLIHLYHTNICAVRTFKQDTADLNQVFVGLNRFTFFEWQKQIFAGNKLNPETRS